MAGVFVCFFVCGEHGRWMASVLWTSLRFDGACQESCWHLSAGSATNIAVLGSLSRQNISSGWCWGHMPDSLGYWCPRYCSEIKLETSHSSDFNSTPSLWKQDIPLAQPFPAPSIPEMYSASHFRPWKSKVLLGSSGIHTQFKGSHVPWISTPWLSLVFQVQYFSFLYHCSKCILKKLQQKWWCVMWKPGHRHCQAWAAEAEN